MSPTRMITLAGLGVGGRLFFSKKTFLVFFSSPEPVAQVSYCDHSPSIVGVVVVRLSVHNLKTTSPPKPLIGF